MARSHVTEVVDRLRADQRRFPALPSTESLRCFAACAETLHFRRAARQVGLTPTAFSERIQKLEAELGAPLFVRTTRHVALTAAGEALRGAVEHALAAVEECRNVVRAPDGPVLVRIGTRFELGLSWLLPATMALERRNSKLKVDLYFGSGEDILQRLERGLLDGVVTSAPVARSDWHTEVLHPETYDFVAAASLVARVPLRRIEDATRHTLLDIDDTLPLARYLLSSVPNVRFAATRACGAGAAILARVSAGDGVAVLPSYMLRQKLKSRRLLRLLPKVRLLSDSFRLLHEARSPRARALHQLAEWLRAAPLS